MLRQHLKCNLTAPRRAGTSSRFFLFLFTQPAVWASETWYSVVWASQSTCLRHDLQRLWYLANCRLLFIFNLSNAESRGTWKVWRTFAWLNWLSFGDTDFFFLMLTRRRIRRGLGERGDKILHWRHSNCTHYDACRRDTAWVFPETLRSASRKTERPFQAQSVSHRTDRPDQYVSTLESKRTLHGVFPDVYFYTQSLQRPHERRPMASEREQVSALFFVAWTQRRLTECFPWATKGSYPPKETLTFKKEFFWQTTSGSLPAGLNHLLHRNHLFFLTPTWFETTSFLFCLHRPRNWKLIFCFFCTAV